MKNYILCLFVIACFTPSNHAMAQSLVFSYYIDDIQVSALSEGEQNADCKVLGGLIPGLVRNYYPNGTFPLEIQSFVVKTPDKTILIDAGTGKNLLSNLDSLLVSPEEVGYILLTHMHGDHIGGLLRNGKRAFPNAELYVSKAEADYQNKAKGGDAKAVLEAYKANLHIFIPGNIYADNIPNVIPGFKAIAAYGHTPGHSVFVMETTSIRMMFWGDISHAMTIQMPHPEVTLSFDSNTKQAAQTRKNVLQYVANNKMLVAGAHIAFPAMGRIESGRVGEFIYTSLPLEDKEVKEVKETKEVKVEKEAEEVKEVKE
jgi:glyoxylase-like metal-dependent hydrolase (beta-lactamase superfamily II)